MPQKYVLNWTRDAVTPLWGCLACIPPPQRVIVSIEDGEDSLASALVSAKVVRLLEYYVMDHERKGGWEHAQHLNTLIAQRDALQAQLTAVIAAATMVGAGAVDTPITGHVTFFAPCVAERTHWCPLDAWEHPCKDV